MYRADRFVLKRSAFFRFFNPFFCEKGERGAFRVRARTKKADAFLVRAQEASEQGICAVFGARISLPDPAHCFGAFRRSEVSCAAGYFSRRRGRDPTFFSCRKAPPHFSSAAKQPRTFTSHRKAALLKKLPID